MNRAERRTYYRQENVAAWQAGPEPPAVYWRQLDLSPIIFSDWKRHFKHEKVSAVVPKIGDRAALVEMQLSDEQAQACSGITGAPSRAGPVYQRQSALQCLLAGLGVKLDGVSIVMLLQADPAVFRPGFVVGASLSPESSESSISLIRLSWKTYLVFSCDSKSKAF